MGWLEHECALETGNSHAECRHTTCAELVLSCDCGREVKSFDRKAYRSSRFAIDQKIDYPGTLIDSSIQAEGITGGVAPIVSFLEQRDQFAGTERFS